MRTQAPKSVTLFIAILLFLVGLLGLYGRVPGISDYWAQICLVLSNILLILGALVKGL